MGYSSPLSAVPDVPAIASSAPADLAVRVRLSFWAYLFGHRRNEAVLSLVVGLGMAVGGVWLVTAPDQTLHSSRYGDMDGHLVGWSCLAIGLFVLLWQPIAVRRQLGDGFSVGADRNGIYLRPNLDKTRVLFLPWNAVEGISVRRWHGPQLVVKPKDAGLDGPFALVASGRASQRAGVAIAQQRRMKRLGTNIHAPISGHDSATILNDLRYQAAGRTPVDMG